MPRPELSTVPPFYHKYVQQTKADDVNVAINENTETMLPFLTAVAAEKWTHRYAEGKWTIKEVVQHLIDAERIFTYRALCFARGERASLPGFEENDYAAASKADKRTIEELLTELETVRKSTAQLYASFDEEQLSAVGIANNNAVSVNAIGFIIAGHVQHHVNVLQERYL